MSANPKRSNVAANAACDAMAALLNGGTITIWDGAQPANADTAPTTQVKLVTLTFANPAFGAAAAGVATAAAIVSGVASVTSTAAWFRCYKSDATTVVYDGTVGTATSDMIIASTAIVSGATISATALTLAEGKG